MIKAEDLTRVERIDRIRKAYIMWRNFPIAELYHEYASISGEFDWVIKPIWSTWDKLAKQDIYLDIAGIDDTIRKKEYIRRFDPSFVTQRTIPEGRDDLAPLLKELGLKWYDKFEVLCTTHGICGNDDLYVSRTPDKIIDVDSMDRQWDMPDYDTEEYGWL